MKTASGLVVLAVLPVFASCGGGGGTRSELERGPTVAGFEFTRSSAVREGTAVDPRYTCDGANTPPPLEWTGVPDGAKELALVLEDPDAPGGTFTHWLVYGLNPSVERLGGDGEGGTGYAPLELREGKNDFGDAGYGGPCPPGGEEHRYVFRLLALDAPLPLEERAGREQFDEALASHVIAEARLTATYRRR